MDARMLSSSNVDAAVKSYKKNGTRKTSQVQLYKFYIDTAKFALSRRLTKSGSGQ